MRKSRAIDAGKENHWRKVFARFQKSSLPFKKFCALEQISPNTFQYWRRELRKRDQDRGVISKITTGDNRPSNLHEQVAHWRQIIAEKSRFQGSAREFCRKFGVSSGTLHYWQKKLGSLDRTAASSVRAGVSSVLVPVRVVDGDQKPPGVTAKSKNANLQDQRIEIRLPHGRLVFLPSNTPAEALIKLLNGLRGERC
jgi:transposase-like protein